MSKTRSWGENPNIQGCLVLLIVLSLGSLYLLNSRAPQTRIARPAPPPSPSPLPLEDWQIALQAELLSLPSPSPSPSPSPTLFLPTAAPTLALASPFPATNPNAQAPVVLASSTPIPPERVSPSPAFIENTPVPLPEGLSIGEFSNPLAEQNPEKFQLPPEQVPLSLHPFDHYYLTRPIDVTANSQYLFYYPYGSSGSQGWRVHHGLDMPNVVGEEVQAAGPGTVVWADRAYETELDGDLEVYAAYGNVVVIEHDFSWRGQKVWTLYAHLSAITVRAGDKVQTGDIIGLVGVTGDVSGPHVHFEVRLGRNSYYSTRNPLLWMAPYVGHGVVAGRVVDEEGRFIDNVLVQLNRGGRLTDSTTTYSNPYEPNKRLWTVVPDDNWNENFALGDIPAGEYQLVAVVEDRRYFQTVQVNAGMTSFVEIQIGGIATPIPVQATAIIPTPLPTAIPLSPTP